MNGKIEQYGVVTDTGPSGGNWKTNNLSLSYTNVNYIITLQAVYSTAQNSTPIVNSVSGTKTVSSFQFIFGTDANYCYFQTIGY